MVYVSENRRLALTRTVLDALGSLEHEQWAEWSKALSVQLREILNYFKLSTAERVEHESYIVDSIKTRLERWEGYWKPYSELPDDVQLYDLYWAEKVLDAVPIKCPVWQCGGFMRSVERKVKWVIGNVAGVPPTADGDVPADDLWQVPDLVCDNCGAVYKFSGFQKIDGDDVNEDS